MYPKHLVELSPTVYVTRGLWYGKNKHFIRKLFPKILPDIKKIEDEFGLKNHSFVFRSLGQHLNGNTYPAPKIAYIDPRRRTYPELLYTIVHEAIHLKQAIDGHLEWSKPHMSLMWKGKCIESIYELNIETVEIYMNLPWEKEAYAKQAKKYERIFGKKPPRTYSKVLK